MRKLGNAMWLLCLAGFAGLALAQDLEIAGKVVDQATNNPLAGVTIHAKGTTISTVSDGSGNYRLVLQGREKATLEFSYSGFKTVIQEVTASNTNLTVSMVPAPLQIMEDMVITGFATSVKRKNLANSVATISEEEISRISTQTLDGAMSGKFTGVTVSQNTGAPGGGISVNLRGISTLNGATQPLYVVDGVIISNIEVQSGVNAVTAAAAAGSSRQQDQPSNRVADLIPYDIESVEILKGPSAAALYGSKASNGVVLITTKKGRSGETQYEFSQTFGTREILKNLGVRRFTAETAFDAFGQQGLDIYNANGGAFFDYEDMVYGSSGEIYETNFSARGGSGRTSYYFSGLGLSDEGIVSRTGYEKYGLRLNLEHQFTDRLSVEVNTSAIRSRARRGLTGNDNTGTTYGISLAFTPSFLDLRPVDGVYPVNPFAGSNVLQTIALMKNEEVVNRTINSAKLDYNILQTSTQSLDFNITAGADYFSMESDSRFPNELQFEAASGQPGTSILGETESRNENLYLNLTHTMFTPGGATFTTTGGLQWERQDVNYLNVVGNGLIEGQFSLDNAAAISVQQNRIIQRDRGFFIQEEINLGEAIFLTAGVRGDSSSTNGDEDKFYTYPKASASIRLSEYDFWTPVESFFSEFKVRVAWGQTGNLPLPTAKFSSFVSSNIGGAGGLIPGTTRGNPNIEPETSEELELGFDATIREGKATIEVTYFQQDISDLLLFRALPPSSGFTQEAINGGEMEVEGFEVGARWNPIRSDPWNWTLGLNFYTYEQLITRLDVAPYNTGGFADSLGRYRIEEGRSPTTIIGAELDADGNFIKLGDETPDYQLGWDNEVRWGNWAVNSLVDWKEGGDVINLTALLTDLGNTTADLDDPSGMARLADGSTSRFIEDGGYIRIRELKLSYDLNRGSLDNIFYGKLSHLRFSLSGRNIKTWTDYSSYDPEVSNFGTVAIGRSVEVTPFPSSKAYYFNIALGF